MGNICLCSTFYIIPKSNNVSRLLKSIKFYADYVEKKASSLGLDMLFLLTTRTADWFVFSPLLMKPILSPKGAISDHYLCPGYYTSTYE